MNTVIVTIELDKQLPNGISAESTMIMESYIGFYDKETDEEYYISNRCISWGSFDDTSNTKVGLKYTDCILRKWDGKHGEEVELTEKLWNKLEPAAYSFSLVDWRDSSKVYANAKEAKIEILFDNFKKEYITEGEPYNE